MSRPLETPDRGDGAETLRPEAEPADAGGSDVEIGIRLAMSWVRIRRTSFGWGIRDYLYGVGDDAIDQGQMDLLDVLARRDAWRMGDLADALGVEPSTATRSVQRLVAAGYAERKPSADDGRVVHVSVSERGRRRESAVRERSHALLKFIVESFEPDERLRLAETFERFIAAVVAFGEHAETPTPHPTTPNPTP